MVRGSAIRVTGLDRCGSLATGPIRYSVSKCVARVRLSEVVENGSNEILRNDGDERRLHFVQPSQTIRYDVDIDFLRVDPGMLSLVAGVPLRYRDVAGFGEFAFGMGPFGGSPGTVVGFDAIPRTPPVAFGLEVWSKLAGRSCADGQQWGYTLFPFLKGGLLSGFSFSNGLVSFNLRGARTQRGSRWGLGPYDLDGPHQRLLGPVSRNTTFRQTLVTGAPPLATDGIVEFEDVIDGGTATMTSEDVLDGQFVVTSPSVVDGGRAR